MSKIQLLLDVVEDLKRLADDIQAVADTIGKNDTSTAPERVEAVVEPDSAPAPEETTPAKAPKKEEVRAVLTRKKIEDARALITKFGAKKLTEIEPENYAALLEEASKLPDDDKRNGGNA